MQLISKKIRDVFLRILKKYAVLRYAAFGVINLIETIVGGGKIREKVLLKLLDVRFNSKFRRDWLWRDEKPHFEDQRVFFFNFAFTDKPMGPFLFYRAFFVSEMIRDGDVLLDIGCGDGFFTKRFYSGRCSHIDALDVEPSAIRAAKTNHAANNIGYKLHNAVTDPFPREKYHVISWDGAIGHFEASTIRHMLQKIREALHEDGVFVGSESLGHEGEDHLFILDDLDDVHKLLQPFFKYIQLREITYGLEWTKGFIRREAYWRCSNDVGRLRKGGWKDYF